MSGKRTALLIVTDTYQDETFSRLRAPQADAAALADVLRDPEIGDYTVEVLTNQPSQVARVRVNRLLNSAERDDLILLYVSGHGVKDESGRLHLVSTDTERQLLAATGVSAEFVRELIDHSNAGTVVVWLDCCYAGAFPSGRIPKAEGEVDVLAQLRTRTGRGCAVMTASTAIQFAYETAGTEIAGEQAPSVFTDAIAEGLRTGAADLNADGEIDAAELYSYVHDRVRASTPAQTPTRNDQVSGELYIAHSTRGLRLDPRLPAVIRQALRSSYLRVQLGAVHALTDLAADGDDVAEATLVRLAEGSGEIAAAASKALLPNTAVAEEIDQLRLRLEVQQRTTAEALDRLLRDVPAPGPVDQRTSPQPRQSAPRRPAVLRAPRPVPLTLPEGVSRMSDRDLWLATLAFTLVVLVAAGIVFVAPIGVTVLAAIGAAVIAAWLFVSFRLFYRDTSVTLTRAAVGTRRATFSPDGSLLSYQDDDLATWHTGTWTRVNTLMDHQFEGEAAFSGDGALLATTTRGMRRVEAWHTTDWTLATSLAAETQHVGAMAFSPSRAMLATSGRPGVVQLWDTETWTLLHQVAELDEGVHAMVFSPDGGSLAIAGDKSLTVLDTDTWAERADLAAQHPGWLQCLAFSPDGTTLATVGLMDRAVRLRSTAPPTVVAEHPSYVQHLAFSPDGRLLATACRDRAIRFWDTADWSILRKVVGHRGPVTSVAFSPDGNVLASTSTDGTVKLWAVG
ncbi:hypothetical protein F0L68_37710 [Solihabitans fulvus]|uniref:Peptidase C14 caspase domain-containing protein n=1 Tax=Solihabitans fulvus TaxID=1892852 RepID=A0A5B2WJS5_9PSEU|nr:caspase family protein [Solihabitans fulvus]KAA2251168.1 hypothetical protein F0L68_37710 [Solihabitans fulvus]